MDLSRVLKHRAEIYGICAIWIVVFHLYRRISMPFIPFITNIVSLGNMSVDIFLFFSGLSLYLSAKRNKYSENGWKVYFKKRVCRIFIPYFIVAIPYFLWGIIVENGHHSFIGVLARFLWNISSASFWIKGVQTTWYVYAIAVFYTFFPVLYNYIEKNSIKKIGILLGGTYLFAIVTSYTPILYNSTIAWSRLPIFVIGIIAGKYSDILALSNWNRTSNINIFIGLNAGFFIVMAWILSLHEIFDVFNIKPVYAWLLYSPMTFSLVVCLSEIYKRKSFKNSFLQKLGTLSLEIYLVHITLLHPMDFFGILKGAGNWNYLILPVCSGIIAVFVEWLENIILKRFIVIA